MKRVLRISCFLCSGLLVLICLYGFANQEMSDIETAILEKNYETAESLAEDFIAKEATQESDFLARYYLGLSRVYLEKYNQAIEVFQELLKQKPDNKLRDRTYLGIIDVYNLSGDYNKALDTSRKLLKISPRSELLSLIYLKRARSHLKLAQWTQAETYLKKTINKFPNSLEARLAKQLLEEKQYFAVQLGAFLGRERAENLVTELQLRGEYAYIMETIDKEGNKFYRVRVGKFSVLDQAKEIEKNLAKLGYPTRIYP